MNTITFQHLCTEESIADIFLIGRTLDDRSVAVKITDVRPHFCVKVPENVSISVLVDELKRDGYVYCISSTILNRERADQDTVPNMYVPAPDDFIVCETIKGQDILDFKERGTSTFLKISCKNPWHTKKLAKYLQGGRLKIIDRQYYNNGTRPYTCPYIQRKLENGASLVNEFVWIRRDSFVVFNDHVNFTLQYLIDRDIYSCSFIEVEYLEQETKKETSCDVEIHSNRIKQVQVNDMAPWRILSYDIESLPRKIEGKHNKYAFPTADRDPIVTIGAVLQKGNVWTQHVWILRPKEEDHKVERLSPLQEVPDEPCVYSPEVTLVYDFCDELSMIDSFIDFIISEDVDFIEGHNINRFDNAYVLDRYKVLMKKDDAKPILGRLLKERSEIRTSTFQSNQKGSIEKFKLLLPGRVILDSYDIMKDQHNESSYKLDSLAEKYLGTKKIAQDYNDIYPMYHGASGYENGKGRHDLAVYCVKDSWLVRKMMDKLCKLTVLLQMSNVTGISMKDVIERGQGIRTIALMLRYAKKRTPFPYFIPRVIKEQKYVLKNQFVEDEGITMKQVKVAASPESFEGAVVVEPDTGFYTDAISCLDFASLYPSIMRALNMSYETLVSRSTVESMNWRQLIGKEEAIGVRTVPDFDYTDMKLRTSINPDNPTFVSSTVRKGLLPEILESVLAERKIVKKQMKALNDPSCTMYKVYDGRQLGLKVVANSIYGFTGAINGFLPEKRIASSVTKYGRYMINQTKEKVENHPVWGKQHGCKCIYGDSVSGNTPLLIRVGHHIEIVMIKDLQLGQPTYTWTEKGWTLIQNIVKHKLATHKKMLQICTHTGLVHCTNDHSLVTQHGTPISPDNVQIGTRLMQSYLDTYPSMICKVEHCFTRSFIYKGKKYESGKHAMEANNLKSQPKIGKWVNCIRTVVIDDAIARIMGMFMGDGSCGSYGTGTKSKTSWAINNSDLKLLVSYQVLCSRVFPEYRFTILPTLKSSGVYKLVAQTSEYGGVVRFVTFWRSLCYNDLREKKVPNVILNSPESVRQSFIRGLYDADGTKNIKQFEISQKGHESCAGIYYLLKSVGYKNIVIDSRHDKPNIFRLRTREKTRKQLDAIKKITEIPYEEYVYDLTTENHHFQAGIGNLIVHNTDSVFVHMPPTLVQGKDEEELMEKAHKKGTEMADYITNIFLPPNELEYEKSYSSFLLLKKKRYAGHKYEPGHPPKLQIKGLEAARRDYAPLLVKTQKKMLNILLLERDKEKAMTYVKGVVSDLMSNKIPLDMLVMSKKLSRAPKDYKAMAAHVNLALRLEKENPEEAPVAGDRVDYVIYCGNSSKTSECACLPSEISSGKYEVDRNYYLDKQLKGPLLRILAKVVNDPTEVFKCNVIFKSRLTTGFMASFLRKRKLPDLENCSTEEKSKRVLNMMSTMVKCQK